MAHPPQDNRNAYQKDGVRYVDIITRLFGGYKKRSIEFLQPEPGQKILDVGCGAGDDVLAVSGAFKGSVEVTGVDNNPDMLAAAEAKKAESGLSAAFVQGHACSLPFEDGCFDRVRADRVFQHIPAMQDALSDMIRVTRPGGLVCVLDVDWDSVLIDSDHHDLSRKILACGRMVVPNPSAGIQLYGLFRRAGLEDIEAYAETVCVRDWPVASMIWGLELLARKAAEAQVVSREDCQAWLHDLQNRHDDGVFFSSITGFVVRGRKKA